MSLYYSVRMAPPTCQHGIYSFQYLKMYCHVLMAPPTCQHSIYSFQYLMMYCHVLRAPPTCQHGICTTPLQSKSTSRPRYHLFRELTKASPASPRQHSYRCMCTPGAPINPHLPQFLKKLTQIIIKILKHSSGITFPEGNALVV